MKKKILCTICIFAIVLIIGIMIIYAADTNVRNQIDRFIDQFPVNHESDDLDTADKPDQVNRGELEELIEIQLHQYDIERTEFLEHKNDFLTIANLLLSYHKENRPSDRKAFSVETIDGTLTLYDGSEPVILTPEEQHSLNVVVEVYNCGASLDVIRVPDQNTVYFDMATGEHALVYSMDGSSDPEARISDRGEYIIEAIDDCWFNMNWLH